MLYKHGADAKVGIGRMDEAELCKDKTMEGICKAKIT